MKEEPVSPSLATVKIEPAADHPDVLSVQDAMRQVLDFFELLTPEIDDDFVWNLKFATKNSPLTVVGEAYSALPKLNLAAVAFEQKAIVEESIRALSEGRHPKRRLSSKRRETIRRIFKRNMNGIGRTALSLDGDSQTVLVTPSTALVGVQTLDKDEESDFKSLFLRDRSRSEYGSLEGTLVEVGTNYHSPAVLITERRTGQEVWCRVSADIRDKISAEMTLNDVWSRSRIIVRGRIRYNADGTINRVWANDLSSMKARVVAVSEITDENFTSGNTIHDYLDRLREGKLG